jgi:putative transposase
VSDAKRLRALEDENAKLKKLLAEAMLDNAMLKDLASKKMVTPAARREAVAHLQVAHEVSERRASSALGADRTSVRYRSHRPQDDDVGFDQAPIQRPIIRSFRLSLQTFDKFI